MCGASCPVHMESVQGSTVVSSHRISTLLWELNDKQPSLFWNCPSSSPLLSSPLLSFPLHSSALLSLFIVFFSFPAVLFPYLFFSLTPQLISSPLSFTFPLLFSFHLLLLSSSRHILLFSLFILSSVLLSSFLSFPLNSFFLLLPFLPLFPLFSSSFHFLPPITLPLFLSLALPLFLHHFPFSLFISTPHLSYTFLLSIPIMSSFSFFLLSLNSL